MVPQQSRFLDGYAVLIEVVVDEGEAESRSCSR